MAGIDDLKREIDELSKLIDNLKRQNINLDTRPLEDSLKRMKNDLGGVAGAAGEMASRTKSSFKSIEDNGNAVVAVLKRIGDAIVDVGEGTQSMSQQFYNLSAGTGIDTFVSSLDDLTAMTRNLRGGAIEVGSAFGQGFNEIRAQYGNYIGAVLRAQDATYQTTGSIMQQAKALSQVGIGLADITKSFVVAGTQQNILSEGFLLAQETGLRNEQVFNLMGTAARTMGVSIENAGRPLIDLENIARDTGLPISQLADGAFRTAQQYSRLGLTVSGVGDVVRAFTGTLGEGFKGLAIEESTRLIEGLQAQIGKTESAFIAMRGGLARPGEGAVGAMLSFEDAFKEPIEVMRALGTTLGGVAGGRIIRFEEARANPELQNQFQIQRQLLTQLTGVQGPQQTRTLLSILADQQAGKVLSSTQRKTLEDAMKSGTQKQEDQRTLADRIGKAQVGLLTQIALNTSAAIDRVLPPQAMAGVARRFTEGGIALEQRGIDMFNSALERGTAFFENMMPDSAKETGRALLDAANQVRNAAEAEAGTLRPAPAFRIPELPGRVPAPTLAAVAPEVGGGNALAAPGAPTITTVGGAATNAGTTPTTNITLTIKGVGDEVSKWIAQHATYKISTINHGE